MVAWRKLKERGRKKREEQEGGEHLKHSVQLQYSLEDQNLAHFNGQGTMLRLFSHCCSVLPTANAAAEV